MLLRYIKQPLCLLSIVSLLPLVSVPTRLPHHPDPNCAVCLPRAADLLCRAGMRGECHFKFKHNIKPLYKSNHFIYIVLQLHLYHILYHRASTVYHHDKLYFLVKIMLSKLQSIPVQTLIV